MLWFIKLNIYGATLLGFQLAPYLLPTQVLRYVTLIDQNRPSISIK